MNDPAWSYPLGLFDAYGIELELMIVDAVTLDVRPACDELFRRATGRATSEVGPDDLGLPADDPVRWTNELALHVLELKTERPVPSLDGIAATLQAHVDRANAQLAEIGCRLLPGGMHPWMEPDRETRLWPHEAGEIYRAYDRIFGCRGHGWGNLQSTHLNLPFANDEEFGRLHAAIRCVLPLIPALAASSPVADGRRAAHLDHRMEVYRTNARRVPMMAGAIVPEPVFDRAAYERDILGRLYDELAPLDPEGLLRHEFANARGAIARFDRGSIEIRVIDAQECPRADVAVCALVSEAVRSLVEERWSGTGHQMRLDTASLRDLLQRTIRTGEKTTVGERDLLAVLGIAGDGIPASTIWRTVLERSETIPADLVPTLDAMLDAGTLASRIVRRVGTIVDGAAVRRTAAELADCLAEGRLLDAG